MTAPTGYCRCGCGARTDYSIKYQRVAACLPGHGNRPDKPPIVLDESTPLICGQHCCRWNWSLSGRGYGNCSFAGRQESAHKYVYELHVGPVPSGMQLDHLCRNRDCVNFNHLEPVTGTVNVRRGAGAKLTEHLVERIRSSGLGVRAQARELGIHHGVVSRVRNGKAWITPAAPRANGDPDDALDGASSTKAEVGR